MPPSPFRGFSAMMMTFHVNNPPMLYFEKTDDHGLISRKTLIAGHPAEILDDSSVETSIIEDVGHPDEVFIHSADIARYLGCSLEAGRNLLRRFEEAGILREHGDIDVSVNADESRSVHLYRPAFDDPKQVMRTLYEMEGERPPNFLIATEEVTPSQFEYIEGSRFRYTEDDSVIIDVARPEKSGYSIQDHISNQLAEHGLAASSLKNFAYQLRQQANLI